MSVTIDLEKLKQHRQKEAFIASFVEEYVEVWGRMVETRTGERYINEPNSTVWLVAQVTAHAVWHCRERLLEP